MKIKYTEDDTFNRLRRPTLEEMLAIVMCNCVDISGMSPLFELRKLLEANNWTVKEYREKFNEYVALREQKWHNIEYR